MSKNYFRINSDAVCRNVILFNILGLEYRTPRYQTIHECLFVRKRRKDKICALSLLWICVNRYVGRHPTPSKNSLLPRSPSFFASTVPFFFTLDTDMEQGQYPCYSDILLGIFFFIPLWIMKPNKTRGLSFQDDNFLNC